jgi:glutaredoxin 3
MNSVRMYVSGWCSYCSRARSLLRGKGVEFEEIDVDRKPEARAQMIAQSGRRTVPQIFIGDKHIGGYEDLAALDAAQGLDPLLAKTFEEQ